MHAEDDDDVKGCVDSRGCRLQTALRECTGRILHI